MVRRGLSVLVVLVLGGLAVVAMAPAEPPPPFDGPTEQAMLPVPAPLCSVPYLSGMTLKASRRQLRRSHCKLGEVRGERSRDARVVRQFRKPGRELPAGTEVGVKLLVP